MKHKTITLSLIGKKQNATGYNLILKIVRKQVTKMQ